MTKNEAELHEQLRIAREACGAAIRALARAGVRYQQEFAHELERLQIPDGFGLYIDQTLLKYRPNCLHQTARPERLT